MGSLRDVLPLLPPILKAQWSISNPTTTLTECRIAGRNDTDIGTVGWTPPLDNTPFAILYWQGDREDGELYPNRIWTEAQVLIFLGVAPAESAAAENYNDLALAWREALKLVVPANRTLTPSVQLLNLAASIGDFRWEVPKGQGGKIVTRKVDNVDFYGIEVLTWLSYSIAVDYQS